MCSRDYEDSSRSFVQVHVIFLYQALSNSLGDQQLVSIIYYRKIIGRGGVVFWFDAISFQYITSQQGEYALIQELQQFIYLFIYGIYIQPNSK